jgi:predicted nucleic acid-binding Zn ribbon protein
MLKIYFHRETVRPNKEGRMHCPKCGTSSDQEAAFCQECGREIRNSSAVLRSMTRRSYLFIVALAPALALVAGLGYYKFVLPDGVAAVVNGEEIAVSELERAVSRRGANGLDNDRYRTLNAIITDRLVLQEARKAGMKTTPKEVAAALAEARASSGGDEPAFRHQVAAGYGSMAAYETSVAQQLLISKFIRTKVVPPGADSQAAHRAVDRWLQEISGRATVRISLSEHGAGPGCGHCGKSKSSGAGNSEEKTVRTR